MNLNQRTVDGLKPGERRIVWHDQLPGFGVRVTEGSTSYIVDFVIGRRRRRVVIGATQRMSFAQALERALQILAGARRGEDLTVNPRRGMPTFGEVWREMIDEVDRPKLAVRTIEDYQDRAKRLILPRIGKKLVGDVTEADVDRIVAATTGTRNRAYVAALVKKTINHAKRARILPDNHRNPADDVKLKRPDRNNGKGRALELEDVATFGKALVDLEAEGKVSPWVGNLLRLSLICGLRPGEARSLTWARVNIPRRTMIVVGKTGEREIHLTDSAVAVLSATPQVEGCAFVFAGRRHGRPIVAVNGALRLVQAARRHRTPAAV